MEVKLYKLYKLKLIDRKLGFDRLVSERSIHGASIKLISREMAKGEKDPELILQLFDLNTLPMKFLAEAKKDEFDKIKLEYKI